MELIREARRTFEQRRRTYGDIFVQDSDSDSDEKKEATNDPTKKDSSSSSNNDSDAPTSTDTDSPFGSDSESSSSYDEYHAKRKMPKKKIHKHHKGPVKLYIQEVIGNWPKYRYKKYKINHMKKHGVQINYGNVHTKQIKHSLKLEKCKRKNEEESIKHVSNMMEDLAKQTPRFLLDPEHPIDPDKISLSSTKSMENEDKKIKSESTFHKMKHKIKKSFKRKTKVAANQDMDSDFEQIATNSDAASHTNSDTIQKSTQSLDKL